MLQAIHDRASGVIAYIIVILISIPFALWGINEYFGGGDEQIVAKVDGNEIPLRAYSTEFQQQQRSLFSAFGGRLPPGFDEGMLKERVLQDLIRRELMREEVQSAGYRISDGDLSRTIQSMPAFQRGGVFDPQRYEQMLASQRRSKGEFESSLRQQMVMAQFPDAIRETAFLPNSSYQEFIRLKEQKRDLRYLVVPADTDSIRAQVGEEEIEKYYRDNQARFRTPPRVRLQYLQVSEPDLAKQIEIDEEALREHYENQADRFVTPEERHARHILIRPETAREQGADQAANDKAARERALEIVKRIRAGEDFATLAGEFSDDSLTAGKGGDLGFIARGDMDAQFEQALFRLSPGQVSDPVRTGPGFEIIELIEVRESEQQPFESVRARVESEYRQREAERRYVEATEALLTLSYEQPDSLEPAADAAGAPIQETDWVTRTQGEGIATDEGVREAAFSEEVLKGGKNSDVLELADGSAVVIRVLESQPAKARSLEEVRDEIVDELAAAKARELALEQGRKVIGELRAGKAPAEVAEAMGVTLETPGSVGRADEAVAPAILGKVFSIPRPQGGKPSVDGVQMPDGAYAVVIVTAVEDGTPDDGMEEVKARLAQDYGTRELDAMQRAKQIAADIEVFRDNL